MDQERINQIYEAVGAVHVELAEDPRVMGGGYIARTIMRCRVAEETVNAYYTEVQQELSRIRQLVSLKELDRKVRLRVKLMSPEIRALEISAAERQAHAEFALEKEYKEELQAQHAEAGQPETQVLSLEEELVSLHNQLEAVRILLDVINEKKGSLSKTDSAVRLQEKSMDTESRLFGPPPTPPQRQNRGNTNGPTQTDPNWEALTGTRENEAPRPPILEHQPANRG